MVCTLISECSVIGYVHTKVTKLPSSMFTPKKTLEIPDGLCQPAWREGRLCKAVLGSLYAA